MTAIPVTALYHHNLLENWKSYDQASSPLSEFMGSKGSHFCIVVTLYTYRGTQVCPFYEWCLNITCYVRMYLCVRRVYICVCAK